MDNKTKEKKAPGKIRFFLSKLSDCTPKGAKILYLTALVSALLLVLFYISPKFADLYNESVGSFVRGTLAVFTAWFPLSFAEIALILLPLFIIAVLISAHKLSKKGNRHIVRMCMIMLAILSYMFSAFVLGLCPGYRGSSLDEKLGIERVGVTVSDLRYTSEKLLDELNVIVNEINFEEKSSSVMPYSLNRLNSVLQDDYKNAAQTYTFLPVFRSKIKPVMLSKPMTYTHISGVYSYFTGESNINVNFPDYLLPYTAAHELAHQRGISREDEANFVAFLVCKDSSDVYVRYSGYLNLFEYVTSALYDADIDAYSDIMKKTDNRILYEMIAYSNFFEKYSTNIAATVSNAVNDTYLKAQGQSAGTESYGMVVDLAVAYYKK